MKIYGNIYGMYLVPFGEILNICTILKNSDNDFYFLEAKAHPKPFFSMD